jgi:hypothetical protein
VFAGFLAFMGVALFAPCRWFGSSFEGACGFAGSLVALFLGVVVFAVVLGVLLWLTLSRRLNFPQITHAPAIKALMVSWIILAVMPYLQMLALVALLISLHSGIWLLPPLVSQALLVALVVVSGLLAPVRGRHPAIALLALLPLIGPILVGVLLFKRGPATTLAASH